MQHTTNDVDLSYPAGGYVTVWWDRSFVSSATGRTGRGLYGYYQVDDIGTRGKVNSNILSLYVQDQWTLNNKLTVNLGLARNGKPFRRSGRRFRTSPSNSDSRTSWRLASARATTGSAMAG